MRDDLKQLLNETAVRRANFQGFNYNPYIADQVRSFIDYGVDRMTFNEYQTPFRWHLAQDNINKLIDTMSYERRQLGTLNESVEITSFINARRSLCPLWPFC
jgi:predicted component of type VI protein secretion system